MLKKVMYLFIVFNIVIKSLGLTLQLILGSGEVFPQEFLISTVLWFAAALFILAYERGARAKTAHTSLFFIVDFAVTAFNLFYAGWIHVFDVEWYHYLIMGTLFTLLVDVVFLFAANRHKKYVKYIKISEETIKNAE